MLILSVQIEKKNLLIKNNKCWSYNAFLKYDMFHWVKLKVSNSVLETSINLHKREYVAGLSAFYSFLI